MMTQQKITAVEVFQDAVIGSKVTRQNSVSAIDGMAVEMFTSWSGPADSDATMGDAVEMFTSWSGPAGTAIKQGDAVEMFTSWSGPRS